MNVVVACSKDFRKSIRDLIESPKDNIKVLHIETLIKEDFIQTLNNINPHVLVMLRGVKYRDITEEDFLSKLIALNSKIRVVYIYGLVTDEEEYSRTVGFLSRLGITDITRGRITPQEVTEVLLGTHQTQIPEAVPLPPEPDFGAQEEQEDLGLEELFEAELKRIEAEEAVTVNHTDNDNNSEEEKIKEVKEASPQSVAKPTFTQSADFDFFVVEREVERETKVTNVVGNATVGVASLLPRSGCTFAAVELAKVIQSNGFDVCVVFFDKETYNQLARYYLSDKDVFFELEGLKIYSPDGLSIAKGEHRIVVQDIGTLSESNRAEYEETQIKVLMCDGSEWNLPFLEDFIENGKTLPYLKQINFCFQNIGKERFSEIYRSLSRKGLDKVFRLTTSESCFQPSSENTKAYGGIMQAVFAAKQDTKKRSKLFGKIKHS